MSESPDIPALIAELRRQHRNGEYSGPGAGAVRNLLEALSVSQPTTASGVAYTEQQVRDWIADANHPLATSAVAAFISGLMRDDKVALVPIAPSVPLTVTAKQIARTIWDAAETTSSRTGYSYDYLLDRVAFGQGDYAEIHALVMVEAEAVLALLARSGGAPNFNSQPGLKETGTSGGAPTAQQVPSDMDFYEAIRAEWRVSNPGNSRINLAGDAARAVLALLSAHPAETEWEYQCLSPFGDWRDVDSDHNCGADRRRSRNDGLWEPVPADGGGEKA